VTEAELKNAFGQAFINSASFYQDDSRSYSERSFKYIRSPVFRRQREKCQMNKHAAG
jgi:hypothetical protein